jgi:dethiobiotin synthetase
VLAVCSGNRFPYDSVMRLFVTGTDTDIGKTVVAAWAMLHLNASYWKPIQAGLEDETDEEAVRRLTGAPDDRFLPSTYKLPDPLSPHEAARRAGIRIDTGDLRPGDHVAPLIIEGAGGLMVPLNEDAFVIDLIKPLEATAILVCRSALGTINHTLLSLQALRDRQIPIAGVVLNGPKAPHNRTAIETYGDVRVLAEIPPLEPLTREALLGIPPEIDLASVGELV